MHSRLKLLFYVVSAFLIDSGCSKPLSSFVAENDSIQSDTLRPDTVRAAFVLARTVKGGMLTTHFRSLDAFKEVVEIDYLNASESGDTAAQINHVRLIYHEDRSKVISDLESGMSEDDFVAARDGGIWKKILTAFHCPFALIHREDLMSIEHLGRRRPTMFGKGDVAFYDIADAMVKHIREEDKTGIPVEDLSEKGYLNTFNHITAQAFMTSIYSERIADFVADVHERHNLPELITGKFSEAQINNLAEGPVDNYIDMMNNEWGQELGKALRSKYDIHRSSYWSAAFLTNYLNEIQGYYSWVFHIGFIPFRPEDEIVQRFAAKINRLMDEVPALIRSY